MKNLTARMENSRAWWQSEIRRRDDERARELQRHVSALTMITMITLAFLELVHV